MVSTAELYWAAGFMEGEGSFGAYRSNTANCVLRTTVSQVQREPLERLQKMFGGNISVIKRIKERRNRQDIFQLYWIGSKSAAIMMTLFDLMSPKRKDQIETALKAWRDSPSKDRQYRYLKEFA